MYIDPNGIGRLRRWSNECNVSVCVWMEWLRQSTMKFHYQQNRYVLCAGGRQAQLFVLCAATRRTKKKYVQNKNFSKYSRLFVHPACIAYMKSYITHYNNRRMQCTETEIQKQGAYTDKMHLSYKVFGSTTIDRECWLANITYRSASDSRLFCAHESVYPDSSRSVPCTNPHSAYTWTT